MWRPSLRHMRVYRRRRFDNIQIRVHFQSQYENELQKPKFNLLRNMPELQGELHRANGRRT